MGRLLLRLPDDVHDAARELARANDRSLNSELVECVSMWTAELRELGEGEGPGGIPSPSPSPPHLDADMADAREDEVTLHPRIGGGSACSHEGYVGKGFCYLCGAKGV